MDDDNDDDDDVTCNLSESGKKFFSCKKFVYLFKFSVIRQIKPVIINPIKLSVLSPE